MNFENFKESLEEFENKNENLLYFSNFSIPNELIEFTLIDSIPNILSSFNHLDFPVYIPVEILKNICPNMVILFFEKLIEKNEFKKIFFADLYIEKEIKPLKMKFKLPDTPIGKYKIFN